MHYMLRRFEISKITSMWTQISFVNLFHQLFFEENAFLIGLKINKNQFVLIVDKKSNRSFNKITSQNHILKNFEKGLGVFNSLY